MDRTPTSTPTRKPPQGLRRSPRLQQPQPNEAPQRQHPALYAFVVEIRVKDTVQQRVSTAKMFGEHHITGDNEADVKKQLWDLATLRIENRATVNYGTWSIASERPVEMPNASRSHALVNSQPWWHNRNDSIQVRNQVGNFQHLTEMKAACIDPQDQDRAGAATHDVQANIAEQLQECWSGVFRGHEMAWLMWAARISKKALYLHAGDIAQPPPSELARWFTPIGSSAEEHVEALRRNVQLASEVVDGVIAHVSRVQEVQEAQFQLLRNGFNGMMDMLQAKKRVIEAYAADLRPLHDNETLLEELTHIPNVPDDCHAP
ncbi:hypothetical protein AC1031_019378 [Aphanomyces cochlioides]|nr:hypothetical protein AC1031_019378 [Aphanomyces cochlioides]